MFFKLLDKLRNKSERDRQKAVLLISIIFTLVIFFLWFFLSDFNGGTSLQATTTPEGGYSPIQSFKQIFSGLKQSQ